MITGARRSSPGQSICISARKTWLMPDLNAIRDAGLTLGLSTHDDAELEPALRAKPGYIAGSDLSDHAEIDAVCATSPFPRSPSRRNASATSREIRYF